MKVVKASVLAPASSSVSTPSTYTSTDSSASTLEGNLDFSNFERSDSGILHSEPEPIALGAINEPKLEEGMTTDLRPDFKERHRKCLHEAITVDTPPAKRTCPEGVQEEPMRDASPAPVPPSDAARSSHVPPAKKKIGLAQDGGAAPFEEKLDKKDTLVSAPLPSWEEMIEMLRRVSCFIDAEPPSTKMLDFFSLTKWISVNLGGDPPTFFLAQLPFGMSKSVISRIQQL